jgi:hypothetical protein
MTTNVKCSCGGKIRVTDFRGGRGDRDFRFEAYCGKCLDCDPQRMADAGESHRKSEDVFCGEETLMFIPDTTDLLKPGTIRDLT